MEPWSRAGLELSAYLLALACFLRGRRAPSSAAAYAWLFPAAFAAAGVAQLRVVAAADGPRPWLPFTCAPHATQTAVLLWAAYAAVLWSVPRVVVTHESARRFVRFLFGLGLVLAAFGLVQAETRPDQLYWVRQASRAGFGPYYDRDHAANVMLMSMLAGIGLFVSRVRRGAAKDGRLRDYLRSQGFIGTGVVFLFAGIVACGSRGALLALLLAGAALLFLGADFAARARGRRARAAAAVAAAAFVVLLVFRYVGAGADAGARVDKSITGRLSIYGDAARWWRDAPLFGTGLGSFETVYPAYQDLELRATVSHAHSDWLEVALEGGALGFLMALAFAGVAGAAAVRAWRVARSREMSALIGGALAAAAAFCVHALFEFCFQIPGNAVFFLAVAGFLLSAPAWSDKASERDPSRPPRAGTTALAALLFLSLAVAAARPAAAWWRADAPVKPVARARALADAYAWDPDPAYLISAAGVWSTAEGNEGLKPLRAALGYSLAAAAARPFDADALFLAGSSLWRLERRGDALALFAASRQVRFGPIAPFAPDERAARAAEPLDTGAAAAAEDGR